MAEFPQSRTEEILYATINGEEYTGLPESRIEELLLELKEVIEEGGGGGGGTSTIAWKPTVAADGTISWVRTASETKPEDQNIKGPKGDTGETGAKGDTGETGPQGPKGDDGDDGDPGLGIKLVSINQQGHLIITFDDDTTQDAGAIPGGGGAVDSVNGQTGVVVLDAEDVGALPDDTTIPTKTSDLTNDSGFQTASDVAAAISGKADSATTLAGYGITDAYTKSAVDTALGGKVDTSAVGTTVASLTDGKVPASQLPAYVDDVIEAEDVMHFPVTGESGKIYVSLDTNKTYRWSGSGYVEISESLALGETSSTAYAGNKGKANADAIDAIKDGTTIDSFSDVESALAGKADTTDVTNKANLKLASSGTTASGEIRFGVDGNGNYGYIKAGADSVTPFKNPTGNKAIPQITQNGTVTGIDVEDYATASLDIAVPAPEHTQTYTPAANTAANDMGANHSYRYVDTSGMVVPSGTKNVSITANGTTTENVADYANASITVNVPDAYLNKIRKAWSELTSFYGYCVWTDGDNIYYSYPNSQYILDKATSTWSQKTWSGLTSFIGDYVWTDGDNIYYAGGSAHYILDKATSTWSAKTWSGMTNSWFGSGIWTDGDNIYYSDGSTQKVLNKSTSTWSAKTWGGTYPNGDRIWTDGENIYYSNGTSSTQFVLDKSTSTWSAKTWNGYSNILGRYIWTDGDNIYYSNGSEQYVLDKSTSTWSAKTWSGMTSFDSKYIWTDGDLYYHSYLNVSQHVLDKIVSGNTWYEKNL